MSVAKKKPEPRGSGSRELHNLSSYKKIIASWTPEINVTKIIVISERLVLARGICSFSMGRNADPSLRSG